MDLTFKVSRQNPELIPPAELTPHEFKPLSDIDNREDIRSHVPFIQFFRRNPSMDGNDPAQVIRSAFARALVYYYPLARRLREHAARKLVVECTGEGLLFIEADADVTLGQFGNLQPPFPCLDDLLYDVPGSAGLLDCPLMLVQVTRLKCGGYILAIRFNHTMCDGVGLAQFLSAVAELARGATAPSVPPVWQRHLLTARVSHAPPHLVYVDTKGTLVHRSFFFGAAEISALRRLLPPHLRRCTTFEILTGWLWRCRTIALSQDPEEEVFVSFAVNARQLFDPPLPKGYYGNAMTMSMAITTAGELSEKPLHFAVDLVRKSKLEVMGVFRVRPMFTLVRSFVVSDTTRIGLDEVDYGWGQPAFGGVARGGVCCFYTPWKNREGTQRGILVPMCFPTEAMEVFSKEVQKIMVKPNYTSIIISKTSAL